MLNARAVYNSVSNGILVLDRDEKGTMDLAALLTHIEAIANLPSLSSYLGDVSGDRGFITVKNAGFVMHAYFVDDEEIVDNLSVRVELCGPLAESAGAEKTCEPEEYFGFMTVASLKEMLRLLDDQKPPIECFRSNAVEMSGDCDDDI